MKVLLVDDNAGVRNILRRAMQEVTFSIQECSSGSSALMAYSIFLPDVVLMDIRMPDMDGLAATRLIKASSPSARVLIVTDYDDDALRAASLEAGACGYVLKQNLTELAETVSSILSKDS